MNTIFGSLALGVGGLLGGVALTTCIRGCKCCQRCNSSQRCPGELHHRQAGIIWAGLGCAGAAVGLRNGEPEEMNADKPFLISFVLVPLFSACLLTATTMCLYAILELVVGFRSGKWPRRCCRSCCKGTPDELLQPHQPRQQKRSKRVMGAATVLGIICGYWLAWLPETWSSLRHSLEYLFLDGPICSLPFVLFFAATAQTALEVCAVEGSDSTSRWLAFTLTMLSFGERNRKGRKGKVTRCFGNPNLSELHGMMCNCVYNLGAEDKRRRWNLLRWFVDKTMPFTFWSQSVSSSPLEYYMTHAVCMHSDTSIR